MPEPRLRNRPNGSNRARPRPNAQSPLGFGVLAQVALVALAGSTGCERGCLATWLTAHGVGGERPGGLSTPLDAGATFDLSGTDCSDGLARCVAGRVELSRTAHIPDPCTRTGPPERAEGCECPWDIDERCDRGCADEGVTIVASAPIARTQLCRADVPVARPPGPDAANAGVCAEEGVTCRDGVVRGCDGAGTPMRAIATCAFGCEPGVGVVESTDGESGQPVRQATGPGSLRSLGDIAMILCRRDQAERR